MLFAELLVRISHRPQWLFDQLKESLSLFLMISSVTDDYTLHLVNIANEVIQSGSYQPVIMGLLRSDYMIDQADPANLLQVCPSLRA